MNGYTSEDCQNRLSGDEDDIRKPLDTISETKSWRNLGQDLESRNQQRMRPTLASAAKIKVKRTSSNSSVESLSRDRRRNSITDKPRTIAAGKPILFQLHFCYTKYSQLSRLACLDTIKPKKNVNHSQKMI